ncbi:hypothetical protein ACFYO2_47125 [Streptomyces sp. NPDC006602]|uniref:hypothetical protein n=1 Tax=Streptomyces sp. NPDC006602 TaxID=3364751 RepID=UPI0036A401FA
MGPNWQPEEKTGRAVFQTSDTSRLVEVTREWWHTEDDRVFTAKGHFRVTVARLVHAKEAPPAHPPEKKGRGDTSTFGGGR